MPVPMPKTPTVLLAALLALAIPRAAHATPIDDFLLTGPGTTISFSLPASPPGNLSPGAGALYFNAISVTDNGVTSLDNIAAPTFSFSGGIDIGGLPQFMGQQLYGPSIFNPTFATGPFTLYTELLTQPFTETFYSLTITPDAAPALTPEPTPLLLLATGILTFVLGPLVAHKRTARLQPCPNKLPFR
jgi:hypothetical protein